MSRPERPRDPRDTGQPDPSMMKPTPMQWLSWRLRQHRDLEVLAERVAVDRVKAKSRLEKAELAMNQKMLTQRPAVQDAIIEIGQREFNLHGLAGVENLYREAVAQLDSEWMADELTRLWSPITQAAMEGAVS